jgi:hypothetical protein
MDHCSLCHAEDLSGDSPYNPAPSVAGRGFLLRWDNHTMYDLFTFVRTTMPKEKPSSLSNDVYIDVLAFILQRNKAPADEDELVADPDVLQKITISKQKQTEEKQQQP